MSAIRARVDSFCRRFGLEVPLLLAPMAGASAPALSIAVMNAGGLGACGALLMQPDEIAAWADEVRTEGNGRYQRSEEHTSELQSLAYLVCRLLLEKKKKKIDY